MGTLPDRTRPLSGHPTAGPSLPALGLLALLLCLLGGCSNRAERLYQRAEIFFAQGQPYLAAAEYHRLATEQPHSSLADDALYKLAYLYREDFANPAQAIQTYEVLADRYPDSSYADDALLWVLQIQGQQLKDAAGVRRTCRLIKERFPGEERVHATAQLQLVKTLFGCARYAEADREAQALINTYPRQERQCAAALLSRAQCLQKQGKTGDGQALKLYEQVVKRYPNTPGAAEAKRSIGWWYYGYRTTALQQERRAKERAARLMGGVPPPPAVAGARLRPFAALSALLAQRQIEATPEQLLTVSGAAFLFAYDPDRPRATGAALERDALTAAAEQYGFGGNVWSAASADSSFASLIQAIGQGRPVMVPQSGSDNWLIVVGYKPAEERVYVLAPGQGRQQALGREQFIGRWARDSGAHTACVTGPYFHFSLGQRGRQPAAAAVLRETARRAALAMNRSECDGVAAGARAYELLAGELEALAAGDHPERLGLLRLFVQSSLPQFLAERRAAAAYLRGAGAVQPAAAVEETVRTGMELRRELASLLQPARGAEPLPEASWPEVAERVRQLQAADERLLNALDQIAR